MKSVGSNPSKLGQLLVISIGILTAASGLLAAEKLQLERIQLPAGFQISLFAESTQCSIADAQPKRHVVRRQSESGTGLLHSISRWRT
jgi:hypothetical protein